MQSMTLVRQLPGRHRFGVRGFSLVEIMVAVAIALIGVIVIFQVMSIWEERKRTTSSGSDAQVAGTIAMYNLDHDLRLAGMGFGLSTYMGCTVQAYDTARGTPAFTFNLFPLEIIDGAAGAPDELRVLYGTSTTVVGNQAFTTSTATTKKTTGRAGFNKGDLALVGGNGTDCSLVEITENNNADALTMDHAVGAYTNYLGQAVTARYNNPAGTAGTFSSGALHNFGPGNTLAGTTPPPRPRRNTWAIRTNSTLAWSDSLNDSSTWFEVAEGIVDLQAQYGVDANNDNMIADTEWVTTTPADWTRVRAVRAAILARSQQYEKLAVTPNAPVWMGGAFVMSNLADGTAWQNYRYRVYEKVIPLRNLIWGTAP
jgi:type IV pilus assembly protein PilW